MWFDEFEYQVKQQDTYKNDDQEETLSNSPDITFADIEDLVKRVNDGNTDDIIILQESVNSLLFDLEIQRDNLFESIENLWEDVMKPFIETDCCLVFNKEISKIRLGFFKWLYDNTNIKKQLDYLILLNNKLNNN